MGWGNSFNIINIQPQLDELQKYKYEPKEDSVEPVEPTTQELVKAYARILNNRKPTHDPYTNPNCYLYYECGCGAILDPQTKRFAELNNHASEKGWKIRFGDDSYVPYCVKCGEDVE